MEFEFVQGSYIRVEEAVLHWSGKSFYVAWTTLKVWKATDMYRSLAIFKGLRVHRPYCAKHNQHAKHTNDRWSGHAPRKI